MGCGLWVVDRGGGGFERRKRKGCRYHLGTFLVCFLSGEILVGADRCIFEVEEDGRRGEAWLFSFFVSILLEA